MKGIWSIVLAFFLVLATGEAGAEITDIHSAINKAGRQRMLSQRMAKAYFQLGLEVDVERSRKVLAASVDLFDRQLADLKRYAPTAEIRDTYDKLERSWLAYKDLLLSSSPSPESGRRVLDASEGVLALAQRATALLERHAGTAAGRLTDMAGRQRMLSQRMAKYYQALVWGVGDAASAAELEKSRREFDGAQQELAAAGAKAPRIREALELVQQQWIFFQSALDPRNVRDKRSALMVASASERILEEMENLVGLYEKGAAR